MLQNATPLRKSAPWLPNISVEHVSCTLPATENASLQILVKCPTSAIVFGNARKPSRFAHFWQGPQSLAPATWNHIWTSKSALYPTVFCTFDFEMCFAPQRHTLFRHLNFQKWPSLVCFVHFDFEMCFAPQRRALFRRLNFQKWSEHVVLLTCWLRNVLRAHTGVQFFISHLPSWLRTRRFRAYFSTLRSHKSLEKHSASRLSYFFARLDLLSSETFSFWSSFFFSHLFDLISSSLLPSFWSSFFFSSLLFSTLLFSSLTLPISAFHLSTLSEVWLLNFLRLVGLAHCPTPS